MKYPAYLRDKCNLRIKIELRKLVTLEEKEGIRFN